MVSNLKYVKIVPGILKCISIILIGVTLLLSALGTLDSEYVKNRDKFKPSFSDSEINLWREIYLLCSAPACFILSVVNLIIHLCSRNVYWNRRTAIYDFVQHSLSFLLLSTAGGLYVISAVKLFEINCTAENACQPFEIKLAAGGVALISAFICGIIAAVVLTNRKDVERDTLLNDDK